MITGEEHEGSLTSVGVQTRVHSRRARFKSAGDRTFDGIICFGDSDWWYHNHGHYDIQMMYMLKKRVPVLYVNSIGVRVPRLTEGTMFFRRILRKLRSMCRGLVPIGENFSVFSPLVLPSKRRCAVLDLLLSHQVKRAAAQLSIARPLVWIACPTAARVVNKLSATGIVYQHTDAYESFPGVDAATIKEIDRLMKMRADVTLFCSSYVFERESGYCRNPQLVDHGVDFERFATAGSSGSAEPDDLKCLRRPRIGFIGGIDGHTFDQDLFLRVARRIPEGQFVLVGACTLPPGWCNLPNVTLLGRRPYEAVAEYMASCDVLIMPWRKNDWIRACNPVKLKEYLAVGKPVVSTPFEELRHYRDAVLIADNDETFARAIIFALAHPGDPAESRRLVRSHTWQAKAQQVMKSLGEIGLTPRQRRPPHAL